MGQWRMRPPIRKEELPRCWAATISSWSSRTRKIPRMTTSKVVAEMRSIAPARIHASGALIGEPGLDALADWLDLESEVVDWMIDLDYLRPKLRRSYAVVVFKIHPDDVFWHAVLVYGSDRLSLCFMDPLLGGRRCLRHYNFALGDPVKYVLWKS